MTCDLDDMIATPWHAEAPHSRRRFARSTIKYPAPGTQRRTGRYQPKRTSRATTSSTSRRGLPVMVGHEERLPEGRTA